MKNYTIVVRTTASLVFSDTVHTVDADTLERAQAEARVASEQEAREKLKVQGATVEIDGECIDIQEGL